MFLSVALSVAHSSLLFLPTALFLQAQIVCHCGFCTCANDIGVALKRLDESIMFHTIFEDSEAATDLCLKPAKSVLI